MTHSYTYHKHRHCAAYRAWVRAFAGLLAFWLLPAVGAATPLDSAPARCGAAALATALNTDGTLRPDARGSFDVSGYRFCQTPDGRPQFHPANTLGTGDDKWQAGFGINGTDKQVKSLMYSPAGDLYAGGEFTTAGDAPAARVAKWDGTRWHALGTGIGSTVANDASTDVVNAVVVDGVGNVYAAGDFTVAGGVAASNVAKWDGTRWSALGTGLNYRVHALAIDGAGNVYAGGEFTQAGSVAVSKVAKWDGTRWSALGTGVPNRVTKLAVDRAGVLYVAATGPAGGAYINKWDGTTWSSLGTGLGGGYSSIIRALTVDGEGTVYVGGNFTVAGGLAVNNVAKWDGTRWSALGTGIRDDVYALALDGAGNCYAAGEEQGEHLLKWNGATWIVVAAVTRIINTLAADEMGGVAVGGTFITTSTVAANYVAKWDGALWSNLATGLNGSVHAVAIDSRGNLYVGGQFTAAGGVAANHIAKWDGTRWSALGTGITGVIVSSLAIDGADNVYAGGSFTRAGATPATSIAKWNGTSWSALGPGLTQASYPGDVYALAIDGAGNVYAGGSFGRAGSLTVNGIGKWNGTNWSALGAGFDFSVRALVLDGTGGVYAGGGFTQAGGGAASRVARWDGTRWHALGAGLRYDVSALALAKNGRLYAGGDYSSTSGLLTSLAAWDGTRWSALTTTPLFGNVRALALDENDHLYVGGSFAAVETTPAKNIVKWDGTTWTTLGTGLDNGVVALAVRGASALYVGGHFNTVGDRSKVTAYVGQYGTAAAPPLSRTRSEPSAFVQLYPNPAHSQFVIKCSAGRMERGWLLNSQGQVVRDLPSAALQLAVDTRELAAGVYTLQVVVQGQVLSQRLLIE